MHPNWKKLFACTTLALLALALVAPVRSYAAGSGKASEPQASGLSTSQEAKQSAAAGTAAEPVAAGESVEKDEKDEYRINAITQWTARQLHIQPRSAAGVFDLLNFAVLFAAIAWFAGSKLPGFFRTRSEGLQKQLVEARTATEDATARLKAIEDRLSRLDDEIVAMQQSADRHVAEEEQKFHDLLLAEKDRIVIAAEQEIATASETANRNLKLYAAELAVATAEKRLSMTPELDARLMDDFLARLAATSADGGKQ